MFKFTINVIQHDLPTKLNYTGVGNIQINKIKRKCKTIVRSVLVISVEVNGLNETLNLLL